jgi:hypothetical protein
MACKNDLYFVMIETHIKENPKFHKLSLQKTISSLNLIYIYITSLENNLIYHCFQNDLKLYMIFGNAQTNHPFSYVKFYNKIGFLAVGIPYWLVHIIWMPNKKEVFFCLFSMLHLCLRIFLSRVPMYKFFGNIFQIIELEIFMNNLC